VKATVDAYTGAVTLYKFGAPDPVLETWMKAFPGTVQTTIPAGLEAHFRYPEDLFKVQRDLIGRYHVTDPAGFYSQEDFWAVPDEPGNAGVPQPAFYQYAEFPKQNGPQFNLTSPLISQRSSKLASFMYVSSDPGEYGQIHVLELPQGVTINGPGQAKTTIETNQAVAGQLTLLKQNGSAAIISGNLLTLPVAGGIIYVQPYYVQNAGPQSFPTLQLITVAYGGKIGYGSTLSAALDMVFGNGAGSTDNPNGNGSSPGTGGTVTPQIKKLALEAQQALDAYQKAVGDGDYAAAGTQQQKLKDLITQLNNLANPPAPKPTGTPTVTPSGAVTGAVPTTGPSGTSSAPVTPSPGGSARPTPSAGSSSGTPP
jgi:uncharacterized protein